MVGPIEIAPRTPRSVVVMGVSGCGKSTVGRGAANLAAVPFIDADDLHPAVNIGKMAAGAALSDDDRWPWLTAVGELARDRAPCVIACSALRRSYRDALRAHTPALLFIHLTLERSEARRRVRDRLDHFMPEALLDSQFETLEDIGPGESAVVVSGTLETERLTHLVAHYVRAAG